MDNYPGRSPQTRPRIPANLILDKKRVNNARRCFNALPNAGQFNQAKYDLKTFPSYRLTRSTKKKNKLKNHFQGIVRLKDGVHFVASVGDKTDKKAVLVVFRHNSHVGQANIASTGPIGSNMKFDRGNNDEIIEFILINEGEPDLWHPGGIGLMGDIVAVPLENFENDTTRVDFYNFSNPSQPIKLHIHINCQRRFGAVDMARLSDGRFICILYSDPDKAFRVYISKSSDLNDGFEHHDGNGNDKFNQEILHRNIIDLRRHITDTAFQAVQILQQNDKQIFLLASGNKSDASPTINGKNYVALLKLSMNNPNYTLSYVDHLIIDSEDDYSNFDAGVGLYGDDIIDIDDYTKVIVQKKNFNDQAMSIRYRLPEGTTYELYEHANYRARKDDNWLTLKGTGKIEFLNDFDNQHTLGLRMIEKFGDKVSSSRFV